MRDFAGRKCPVYVIEDEYDANFVEKEFRIDEYETHTIPQIPSQHMLCMKDKDGIEREIRNRPKTYKLNLELEVMCINVNMF